MPEWVNLDAPHHPFALTQSSALRCPQTHSWAPKNSFRARRLRKKSTFQLPAAGPGHPGPPSTLGGPQTLMRQTPTRETKCLTIKYPDINLAWTVISFTMEVMISESQFELTSQDPPPHTHTNTHTTVIWYENNDKLPASFYFRWPFASDQI